MVNDIMPLISENLHLSQGNPPGKIITDSGSGYGWRESQAASLEAGKGLSEKGTFVLSPI